MLKRRKRLTQIEV
jgi:polo-like kinase 1